MKNAGKSRYSAELQGTIIRIISYPKNLSRLFIQLGEILDYQQWLRRNFNVNVKRNSREAVWDDMRKSLTLNSRGGGFSAIEFGVAWGYLTNYWFRRAEMQIITWDGFDRFTGLPRSWRNLPEGAFDAGGIVPQILDTRISWHVGDIIETIKNFNVPIAFNTNPVVIFFDLDIFEPSLAAWMKFANTLKKGDILYFDEAFDRDERKLLDEYVLKSRSFKIISCSWTSLAIIVD
jgi:hypothetical protein